MTLPATEASPRAADGLKHRRFGRRYSRRLTGARTSEVNNGEHETTAEKKAEGEIQEEEENADAAMRRKMMRKSRSVAVPMMSSKAGSGDDTLLIHEGVKVEEVFEKSGCSLTCH